METQKRRIKAAIVILNWNGKDWLEKFLPTIIQHSNTAEIIIADNGSTDDSLLFLSKNLPEPCSVRFCKVLLSSSNF